MILLCLKSAPSNLFNSNIWQKNKKDLNLALKMPYSGIFGPEFENDIVISEISVLEFVLLQGFGAKTKILKFETKNVLFSIFGLKF